jgi:uncharacterized repeat protein (TIGR01451 family)
MTKQLSLGLLLLAIGAPAAAIQAIDSIVTSQKINNGQGFTANSAPGGAAPFGTPTDSWTVTFTGNDDDIDTVRVGGIDYEFVTLADELRLRREDNPSVSGERDLVFCRGNPNTGTNTIPCDGSTFTDMETILLGRSVNYGTDNVFSNVSGNSNNIERIDYIYKTGISINAAIASDIGFVVLERGGNDQFKIGAILTVDANYNPTSIGTLVTVNNNSHWGASGFNYDSVVFRRDPVDTEYRPSSDLGSQNIEGVFITFADLGLSSGDQFFGYALFADDVDNDDDLEDHTTFPLASGNGLDLVEGGGFFQRSDSATDFVDIQLTKVAVTPTVAPGAEAIFTVVVENRTQNRVVVDADFTDALPTEFSNIRWTCQASGFSSSCLSGTVADNGSPSSQQGPIVGNTITDELDIGIGGSVTYVIRASLSGSASGLIDNTASVVAGPSQTEISASNNTDVATVTVQAPASGDKLLYLHTDGNDVRKEISRVPVDSNTENESINDGATETWLTDPDIVGTVTISGPLGLYVAARARDDAGTRTIDFILNRVASAGSGATTQIATATTTFNFTDTSTVVLLTPTVTMSVTTPFDINPDDRLELLISPSGDDGDRIYIHERSSSAQADMSRIEIPTTTVIAVDSISFSPTAPAPGDDVTITAVVSDPFGEDDITAATFDWFNSDGVLVLNDQVMSEVTEVVDEANTKTFAFIYTIPDAGTSNGNWRANVTVVEGFEEVPITHTASKVVTVGAPLPPSLTVVKFVNGVPSTGLAPGALPVYQMTVTNNGPGPATNVVLTVDIGQFVSFGVDSQSGEPFTFLDIGTVGLPTNFMGIPEVSIGNGAYESVPSTPVFNPEITNVRIQMNGTMEVAAQFRLIYQGLVE